jgi:putative CocE/NonD family hydrolase
MVIDWFRAHLEREAGAQRGARIFLTGRNEWVTREPLQPVPSPTVLWLASGGSANTRRGDGRLVTAVRDDTVPDRFTYNPENPVPWQPGFGSFSRNGPTKLALDTAFATGRDDVLVYDAAATDSDVLICGYATAYLWVQTDAPDADWIAALEDVFPGGSSSVHLAHGIVRTAALDGVDPGKPLELAIRLSPIAHELLTGHSLRLVVTSSLWPLYAVNFGGEHYLDDAEPRISEHTVFHDSRFPSRIELPVASPEADRPARS